MHTRCARCILCTILPSPWNEWYHCYIIILGLWNKVNKTLISSLQVLLVIIYSFYRIRCSLYNTLSTLFKFIMVNKVHSWEWLVLSRRPRCQHDIYEYCFPTLADALHVLNPCLALIRHRSWHIKKYMCKTLCCSVDGCVRSHPSSLQCYLTWGSFSSRHVSRRIRAVLAPTPLLLRASVFEPHSLSICIPSCSQAHSSTELWEAEIF